MIVPNNDRVVLACRYTYVRRARAMAHGERCDCGSVVG